VVSLEDGGDGATVNHMNAECFLEHHASCVFHTHSMAPLITDRLAAEMQDTFTSGRETRSSSIGVKGRRYTWLYAC